MKKNLYNEFNFGSEHNISSQLLSNFFFVLDQYVPENAFALVGVYY